MKTRSVLLALLTLCSTSLAQRPPGQQRDTNLLIERAIDRAGRARTAALLDATRVDLRANDMTAHQLAKWLGAASAGKVNFAVVTSTAAEDLSKLTVDLPQVTPLRALGVVGQLTDLRFVYRAGVVVIKPKDEVRELRKLQIYDVRAAVAPLRDRPGPTLTLATSDYEQPMPVDDATDKTLSGFTIERIESLIREQVDPDSWDEAGTTLSSWNGVLMIRQTDRNHAAIRRLMTTLGVIGSPTPTRTVRRAARRPAATTVKPAVNETARASETRGRH